MDDISRLWDKFSLNGKEDVPFDFGPANETDPHFLAARFMISCVINIESVVRTFRPLWRTVKGFIARDMGSNMLVFAFEDVSNLERVLHGEPWSYDKHLVTFQRVDADTSIAEMECRWVSFWVQIHNLPVRRMNHDTASALGGTLGVVEKVVESDEERGREGCIRIRVKLDVSQPLCRGRKARLVDGKETLISFKYERLPNFCYLCGRLTHGDRVCERWLRSRGSLPREDQQYGAWLRASVEKPIRRVEVKVAGRSNIPRWGASYHAESRGVSSNIPSESGGTPATGEKPPSMDFTKIKESLPDLQEFPCPVVGLGEKDLNRGECNFIPPSIPVESNPNITVVNEMASDTQDSSNHRSDADLIQCQPLDFADFSAPALQQLARENITGSLGKSRRKYTCKIKEGIRMQFSPGGKENLRCEVDLKGMYDDKCPSDSRGAWKHVLREKDSNIAPGGYPLLSGIKRVGSWPGDELQASSNQKKAKGKNGSVCGDVDGDLAEAVDQPRRTQ